MAVDTRNRRFSMMSFGSPMVTTMPNPDGVLDIDDRPQLLKLYAGLSLTGGSAFDYEYNLQTAGEHTFYSKSHRKSMVIPNYVTVESTEETPLYSGVATDPSAAILRVDKYVKANVTSNAQAVLIANAIIAKARQSAEKGSAVVPMNVGQEVYDYIKTTDQREGDFRIGNVGYIKRRSAPGTFDMEVRLGRAVFSSMTGTGLASRLGGGGRKPNLDEILYLIEQLMNMVNSILDYLKRGSIDETAFEISVGDGVGVIPTGIHSAFTAPFGGVIQSAELDAPKQSGSIVIDIWKDTYANSPPTNADSICGGNEPTLSSAQKSQDTTLTSWTRKFNKGDRFYLNVDSCTTITLATLTLRVTRS